MSSAVLVIGQSGTGKSTAIRTLPANETFIINVLGKPLPFRGAAKNYITANKENPEGNYFSSDSSRSIIEILNFINNKRPDIKYVVLDDFGYVMVNDFMTRALQKGFDKFNEISLSTYNVLTRVKSMRPDLITFVMMHSDLKEDGYTKPKTIGKMTDEKVCVEGMFTYVLHSLVFENRYCFLTNTDGKHMAKTPQGMFTDKLIDNDLKYVCDAINHYNNEDLPL